MNVERTPFLTRTLLLGRGRLRGPTAGGGGGNKRGWQQFRRAQNPGREPLPWKPREVRPRSHHGWGRAGDGTSGDRASLGDPGGGGWQGPQPQCLGPPWVRPRDRLPGAEQAHGWPVWLPSHPEGALNRKAKKNGTRGPPAQETRPWRRTCDAACPCPWDVGASAPLGSAPRRVVVPPCLHRGHCVNPILGSFVEA